MRLNPAQLVAVLLAASSWGCTGVMIERHMANLPPNLPPQYRDGFRDGCGSGMAERCLLGADGQYVRDEHRMRSDREYETGWHDGARRCTAAC